jgi:hypothetical protein
MLRCYKYLDTEGSFFPNNFIFNVIYFQGLKDNFFLFEKEYMQASIALSAEPSNIYVDF